MSKSLLFIILSIISSYGQLVSVDSVTVDSVWNSDSSWLDANGVQQTRESRDCSIGFFPTGTGLVQCIPSFSIDSGLTFEQSPNLLLMLDNTMRKPLECGFKYKAKIRVLGADQKNAVFRVTARQYKEATEIDSTTILMIGNSQQNLGINFNQLAQKINRPIMNQWSGGMYTAWEFCVLYNALRKTPKPYTILFSTVDNFITDPSVRTTGYYAETILKEINGNRDLQRIYDSILTLGTQAPDKLNFSDALPKSFLPLIIHEAKNAGVPLIISRFRLCSDVAGEATPPCDAYRDSLTRYLYQNDIPFLDFTKNPEIMAEHFLDCSHYNDLGRTIWTRQMGEYLNDILNHQWIGCPSSDNIDSIICNSNGVEKTTLPLQLKSEQPAHWSMFDFPSVGEQYIGYGSKLLYSIPTGKIPDRTIRIFAYDGCKKWRKEVLITGNNTSNRPPTANAGPDGIMTSNIPYRLNGSYTDDSSSPLKPPKFKWTIVSGVAKIQQDTALCAIVTKTESGTIVLRLTVDDGELSAYDQIQLTVNANQKVVLLKPDSTTLWQAGETGTIEWAANGLSDAFIKFSLDGGENFELINEVFHPTDSSWGRFLWHISPNIPTTHQAVIFISDYNGKNQAYSPLFTIKGQ